MIATVGAPGEVISGPPGDHGEPGSQGPAVSAKFHYTDRTRPDQTKSADLSETAWTQRTPETRVGDPTLRLSLVGSV